MCGPLCCDSLSTVSFQLFLLPMKIKIHFAHVFCVLDRQKLKCTCEHLVGGRREYVFPHTNPEVPHTPVDSSKRSHRTIASGGRRWPGERSSRGTLNKLSRADQAADLCAAGKRGMESDALFLGNEASISFTAESTNWV